VRFELENRKKTSAESGLCIDLLCDLLSVSDVVYIAPNPSKRPASSETNFSETSFVLEVNGRGFAMQYLFRGNINILRKINDIHIRKLYGALRYV
jgi:hypothetical protein